MSVSELYELFVALGVGLIALLLAAALAWAVARLWRSRRRRRDGNDDVVIDLTYMEQAIRRTRDAAEREAQVRRDLSEPRSTSPEGGGR